MLYCKKKYRIIILICLILSIALQTGVSVFAATSVDVTITATPMVSNGIKNFLITYISDTQLDLTWEYDGAVNIMIRSKYGSYPVNPPNEDTAPSDGNLVYYGNGVAFSDTSMDFENNTAILYYSAWGQKADGKWFIIPDTGNKESVQLILLAFIGSILAIGVINFGFLRNSFIPYKLAGALMWMIPIIWIITNPPSIFTAGNPLQVVTFLVLVGIGLISLFGTFRSNLQINKTSMNGDGQGRSERYESNGWHVPMWMKSKNQTPQQNILNRTITRKAKLNAYENRMYRALHPELDERD